MSHLAPHLRLWFVIAILIGHALHPRAGVAQQPGPFGPPGANFEQNGANVPTAPNNQANFGGPAVPTQTPPPGQGSAGIVNQGNTDPNLVPLEGGQIIARVGNEVIVAGDVLPRVNQILQEQLSKVPPEQRDKVPPDQIEQAKRQLMQRELLSLIETKLLFGDAKRNIPQENFPTVLQKLDEQFDKAEMPQLLKESETKNRVELDQKFVRQGTSLMQQKRAFSERLLAMEWLKQQIDFKTTIHHDEMLAYYHEHIKDYEFEAKAKFEEIMVRFDRFPNKGAAYAALAEIGNQLLNGANFTEIAKVSSQGPTAKEGGYYDFVSRGSLVLPVLNEAVFTLPVGQLSQIIESQNGFHIVRVIERRDAGRTGFDEAQIEIRKKLQRENSDKQIKEYLAKLRNETRVWTAFDGPVEQQALRPN